ncbi:StbB [Photobacterium phosphoreum]|jgi:flagellar hook-basal body complex protein FliE|uniref:StbB family protein n=1 Tax=Photobacterium phosphoreum TaxID=659 RepID=UPI000D17C8B8|nr:StbB family protein [Photobacterium phosphoreum]PSU67882.1 StbB [Photobacterium phosphoreum]PSW07881.1 StbB [Photobacterium phosphoreum]
MNIIVINFSGNVGKSIVSQYLLAPRLNDATIISIESINTTGHQEDNIKGKYFDEIMAAAVDSNNAILDVGASNVEEFINQMKDNVGSEEDFDYFIIPTINRAKQISDTISTINTLTTLGVEKNKIRVLFNMVGRDDNINKIFIELIDVCSDVATINTQAVIYENNLFNRLMDEDKKVKIIDIVNDDTDFSALIKASNDSVERQQLTFKKGTKRLAVGVQRILDEAFIQLFK